MKKLIFITGGARSGKSRFAVELAKGLGEDVTFLATCIPEDEEMKKRIELHKKSRPQHWKTIEEGKDVVSVLHSLKDSCKVVIVDCLTLFISNLLASSMNADKILQEVEKMAMLASAGSPATILVSNEVGLGLVPENRLGRDFRDIVGAANQVITRHSDEAYLMVSGMPLKVKGGD